MPVFTLALCRGYTGAIRQRCSCYLHVVITSGHLITQWSVQPPATRRPAIHYLLFVMGSHHRRSSQHRSLDIVCYCR